MYLRIHLHTANTRGRACIYVSIYIQLIPEAEYGSMYLYTANTRLCRPHFTLIFIVFMGFFSFSSFVSLIIMTYKADWVLKTKTNLTLFFCIVSSSTTLKTDIFLEHAAYFGVSIIYRTLTRTTGSLGLMHVCDFFGMPTHMAQPELLV